MGKKMYRVEDKFECSMQDFLLLEKRIEKVLKRDVNQRNGSGYTVTSLYFDDLNDSNYRDTIEGSSIRKKYRIRIYNHSFDTIKLEVKEKKYSRILKRACPITKEEMELLIAGKCISDTHKTLENPITLFNTAIQTKGLRPKVIVEYDRDAYIFKPGNVRITFDKEIRASRQIEAWGKKEIYFDPLREANHILEVKYDEYMPEFILQMLENGNMRQTSYSKYRLCRERKEYEFSKRCY